MNETPTQVERDAFAFAELTWKLTIRIASLSAAGNHKAAQLTALELCNLSCQQIRKLTGQPEPVDYGTDEEEGAPAYDYATFSVDVTRHVSFHLGKFFLPLLVIVFISFSVFWIDPEDLGSSMSVGVTRGRTDGHEIDNRATRGVARCRAPLGAPGLGRTGPGAGARGRRRLGRLSRILA